jgi:UrcA family protein
MRGTAMIESTTKHETTLARAAIAVAVALAWCLFAYVVFVSSESSVSVLNLTDVDLSKPAAAVALYERIKSVAAIYAGGRTWALKLAASRLACRLRGGR